MTFFIFVSCFAYLMVAVFAGVMTYCEQQRKKTRKPLFEFLGYLACTIWPLTLLTVTVAVFADRNSNA